MDARMGQPGQEVAPAGEQAVAPLPTADKRLLTRFGLALGAAVVVAVPVAVLAIVVKHTRGPVARLDLAVARGLHGFAVEHGWFVSALDRVSSVGQPNMFRLTATVAAFWLLSTHRSRLALWALVTTWGGALLGVLLKLLVERARPALPDAVAHADGYSFPSGHALGAFVGCAVLLLLWLNMARPRQRWLGWAAAAIIVVAVCFARMGLGVHYLSDVVGGCLVGLGWTAATTIVFQVWRKEAGLGVAHVVTDGIEPERVEPDDDSRPLPSLRGAFAEIWRHLPRLLLPWIGLVFAVAALGELITHVLANSAVGRAEDALSTWLAAHRTPTLNELSAFCTLLGETNTIAIVTIAGYLGCRLFYRRWLEPTALLFAVVGEVWGFILVTLVIDRPRPAVPHLDAAPPTSSFPSGHTAATVCCYGALALLATRHARRKWPAFVGVGILVVAVAVSRLYRGMHHLTDVLAGVVYGVVWLTIVAVMVLRRDEQPAGKLRGWRRRPRRPQ
jgi:membrane-associated phospholipid phosphatase